MACARSDGNNYGKLIVNLSKINLWSRQIEARIDQDPDISQEITLWSTWVLELFERLLVFPLKTLWFMSSLCISRQSPAYLN